jgi:hypothetical protein
MAGSEVLQKWLDGYRGGDIVALPDGMTCIPAPGLTWLPIEDAPKDGREVLLSYPSRTFGDAHCVVINGYWSYGFGGSFGCWCSSYYSDGDKPTHYAEFNPPPGFTIRQPDGV